MEQGPTFDVVDTTPPDRRDWPSPEDFQEREEIIKWRDVRLGIYKILEKHEHGRSKYGPSIVLKLEHEKGPIVFAWAPSSLIFEMEKKKTANFILNFGQQKSEEKGYPFYDFKLC